MDAYRHGIFPWFGPGDPLLWWSPDPRMVLRPRNLHLPKSSLRQLRKHQVRVTGDQAFDQVVLACARTPRKGQRGTWIVPDMRKAYHKLHRSGWAHSLELWQGDQLVGGVYGVLMGPVFCGESMFGTPPVLSQAALTALTRFLPHMGVRLIDGQVHSPHLERMGFSPISRRLFLRYLDQGNPRPAPLAPSEWSSRIARHFPEQLQFPDRGLRDWNGAGPPPEGTNQTPDPSPDAPRDFQGGSGPTADG